MTNEELIQAVRKLLHHLTHCSDCEERPLVCTPCGGNYGTVAAWVVAVNGSPTRGFLFLTEYSAYVVDQHKSRRLGDAQAALARKFERQVLNSEEYASLEKAAVITIPGVDKSPSTSTPSA